MLVSDEMVTAVLEAVLDTLAAEGLVVVPREANEIIIDAALDAHAKITPSESPFGRDGYFASLYRAMVTAAHSPPSPPPKKEG